MSAAGGTARRGLIRQGDVLLIPVGRIPERCWPVSREGGRLVLAEGEATGHAHVIDDPRAVEWRVSRWGGSRLVVVGDGGPVLLEHAEHDALQVPAGVYEVRVQREYTPRGQRRVRD
jgi:hypothetical protein